MTEKVGEEFTRLGLRASHHFADDTTKEWSLGCAAKREALEIFDAANEEEQEELRKIARGFLWSLNMERPV